VETVDLAYSRISTLTVCESSGKPYKSTGTTGAQTQPYCVSVLSMPFGARIGKGSEYAYKRIDTTSIRR
jgi:hypothetical protein